MKIDRLELVNFMGIKGRFEFDMPHVAALIGKNGMGKTTILNAIRYALTGTEPEGDIINNEATQCQVTIQLTDPSDMEVYEFTRIKDREKPSKFKINGKATTQKTINEKIEDIIGISLEKIRLLSSSEVVAAMKPQEFSSYILDYIPEKMKLDTVIGFVPDSTMGMIDILEANLPDEGIDLQILDEFAEQCKYNRKELKTTLANMKALYESKPKEAPAKSKIEIEKELEELVNVEATYKVYLAQKDAYERAVASLEKQQAVIRTLKEEMAGISAERPNVAALEAAKKNEATIRETIQNIKVSMNGATTALRQLELTLSALEKPICPISPLITCHQDKTMAKEEISESIVSTKEGISAMGKELVKSEKNLAEASAVIAKLSDEARLYEKKIQIAKQIKTMEDSKTDLPKKPDEVEVPDVETKKYQLNMELKAIAEYESGLQLQAQIKPIETECADYEALCKATAEKGPIRTGVISSYLKVFEDLCNERSSKVRPEIRFRFVSDNGVVVLMDAGKGVFLPYASLSGGEKAYMIFIIMDMLNQLTGTNLLLLDELSVIDEKCFDALLDIVMEYTAEYDHVILAAVDHIDTVRSVETRKIPMIGSVLPVEEKVS